MNKRYVLSRIIRAMLMLFGLAFAFVLFRSLGGPSLPSSAENSFDSVVIGQSALRRLEGQRVWVTRLSKSQVRHANEISAQLVDSQAGCKPSFSLCIISAKSSRDGIEIVYSRELPAQLPNGAIWYGGFIDPASGGVFDVLGRAYRDVRSNDKRAALNILKQH